MLELSLTCKQTLTVAETQNGATQNLVRVCGRKISVETELTAEIFQLLLVGLNQMNVERAHTDL